MISVFLTMIGACVTGLIVTLVLLNWLIGCEDWADPACITPSEIVEW